MTRSLAAAATSSLVLYVSECEGNFDLRSPVGSDDLCAVLRPLCGLRLLSVCVCVCLFSIHVGTVGVDVENRDIFIKKKQTY